MLEGRVTPTVTLWNPGTQNSTVGLQAYYWLMGSNSEDQLLTYSVANLPPGLSINATSGAISGTVASTADTTTPYSVTATATDSVTGDDASQTFSWSIAANTTTVTLSNPGTQNGTAGSGAYVGLMGSTTSGNMLSYSASGLPSGLYVMGNTITGTLGSASAGTYSVTVTATDAAANVSASQTFTWNVATNTPTVSLYNPGNQSSRVGSSPSLWLMGMSSTGGTLTYSASGLPAGLSIANNYGSGVISGTVTAAVGSYSVTVTASAGGVSASQSFTWDVTPKPVSLTNPGNKLNATGDTVSLTLSATSATGGQIMYWASGLPAGLSIENATGVISGTITNVVGNGGYFTVNVSAYDYATAFVDTQTFHWAVNSYPAYVAAVAQADVAYADAVNTVAANRL